jgi:hypothetical protein
MAPTDTTGVPMLDPIFTSLSSKLQSPFGKSLINAIREATAEVDDVDSGQDIIIEGDDSSVPTLSLEAKHRKSRSKKKEDLARIAIVSEIANDLRLMRNDVRKRANRAFNYLIAFASVATVAILIAIGLVAYGERPAGGISVLAGLLSGATAAIFRGVYLTETKRADVIISDLQRIEAARVVYLLSSGVRRSSRPSWTIEKLSNGDSDKG